MNRLYEEYELQGVYGPQSLAASTAGASDYVLADGASEIEFDIVADELTGGKTLKVAVYGNTTNTGTATKLAEETITVPGEGSVTKFPYRVSVRPQAAYRFYKVEITHAETSATDFAIVALIKRVYDTHTYGLTLAV